MTSTPSARSRSARMPRQFVVVLYISSTAMTTGRPGPGIRSLWRAVSRASKRWVLIDPDVSAESWRSVRSTAKATSTTAWRRRSATSGAEVVIYGRAAVQVSNLSVLKSKVARASANIRAVNVQTGQIIAMSTLNHPKKAPAAYHDAVGTILLKKVGEAAAADLIKQIVKQWQKDTSGATRIVLTVKGVKFRSAKQLKAAMGEMRGVSSIQRRSLKRGVAVFDVNVGRRREL